MTILHVGYTVELKSLSVEDAQALQKTAELSELELADIAASQPFFAMMFYKKTYRRSPASLTDQQTMHAWYLKHTKQPRTGKISAVYVSRKKGVLQTCVCELVLDGTAHYVVLKHSHAAPLDDKRWANTHQDQRHTLTPKISVECAAYEQATC